MLIINSNLLNIYYMILLLSSSDVLNRVKRQITKPFIHQRDDLQHPARIPQSSIQSEPSTPG